MSISAELTIAARSADAADWKAAADALLAAWRENPAPAIGKLVVAIDARMAPAEPVVEPRVAARETAWLELARDPSEDALRRLLATPWPAAVRAAAVRVDALLARPASPRIAHALIELGERRVHASRPGAQLASHALQASLERGDLMIAAYLEELAVADPKSSRGGRARAIPRLLKLPRPTVPVFEDPALARIVAALGSVARPDRDTLLAAIYANPDDDGPRMVFADVLVEAGDPYGELIALQLARARGGAIRTKAENRERSLLREAGTAWTAALVADHASQIELARGFPFRASTYRATYTPPAWATIEELGLATTATVVASDQLRALRRLRAVPLEMIANIRLPEPARLEELAIVGSAWVLPQLADLATPLAPKRLGLQGVVFTALPELAGKLASWPIARRTSEIVLASTGKDLQVALAILRAAPQLACVELLGAFSFAFGTSGLRVRVGRDRLELALGPAKTAKLWHQSLLHEVHHALENLAAPPFREIELDATAVAAADEIRANAIRELEASVAAWPQPAKVIWR